MCFESRGLSQGLNLGHGRADAWRQTDNLEQLELWGQSLELSVIQGGGLALSPVVGKRITQRNKNQINETGSG